MMQVATDLAFILAWSTPLIFATMGETLTERSGMVNLSLDGTILLSAMVGFAVGVEYRNVVLALLAAAGVGVVIALLLCIASISLRQSQLAVGFVLTLFCTELSSFLGNRYVRVPGVVVPHQRIPLAADIPLLGPILFDHDPLIYSSFVLVPAMWWFLYRTRAGLVARALGERPEAAFARGVDVNRLRYWYAMVGGALAGLAGAAYSLDIKQGWSHRHTAGMGWIALAIVIFGGWNPWRVALGCYLFGLLQVVSTRFQPLWPMLPTQVFQVAPFVLMIAVLLVVSQRKVRHGVPAALGKPWSVP